MSARKQEESQPDPNEGSWVSLNSLAGLIRLTALQVPVERRFEEAVLQLLATKREKTLSDFARQLDLVQQAYRAGFFAQADAIAKALLATMTPGQCDSSLEAEASQERLAGPVTMALYWSARIAETLGDFDRADGFWRRLLRGYEKCAGVAAKPTVLLRHGRAVSLLSYDAYDLAQLEFEKVVKALENDPGANEEVLAKALSSLGNISTVAEDYEAAERYLQRAFAIENERYRRHQDSTGLAATLQNMAILAGKLDRNEEARSCLEQAAELFKSHTPFHTTRDPDWPYLLYLLAECYGRLGLIAECLENGEGALESAQAIFGAENVRVPYFLLGLASLHKNYGKPPEAITKAQELFLQAVRIGRKHEPYGREVAAGCDALARIYEEAKKWRKAEIWLKRAITCYRRLYERMPCEELVDLYERLVDVYVAEEFLFEAGIYEKRARRMRKALEDEAGEARGG